MCRWLFTFFLTHKSGEKKQHLKTTKCDLLEQPKTMILTLKMRLRQPKNTTKRTTFKSIKLKTNLGFTNSKSTAKQIRKKRQLNVKTSPCDFLIWHKWCTSEHSTNNDYKQFQRTKRKTIRQNEIRKYKNRYKILQ